MENLVMGGLKDTDNGEDIGVGLSERNAASERGLMGTGIKVAKN